MSKKKLRKAKRQPPRVELRACIDHQERLRNALADAGYGADIVLGVSPMAEAMRPIWNLALQFTDVRAIDPATYCPLCHLERIDWLAWTVGGLRNALRPEPVEAAV